MNLRKLYFLMLILPLLFFYTGCSDDDGTTDPPATINEAEVLVKYLESDGGKPLEKYPSMISAKDVNPAILAGADQFIMDIRSQEEWDKGHITGSVYVNHKEVLAYYEANNLQDKATVVIACFSGQTAGWATSLLRMMGYTNVKDLKWGMSSWNDATSGPWNSTTNRNNSQAAQFVTASTAKTAKGDLPKLDTGKKVGKDILRTRVEAIFAEGFIAKVSSDVVYSGLSNYHIANYWSEDHYNWGHINGAMQYSPKAAFTLDADLTTLPTDKKIAVYCYTGQTSAHVAAYLRVLGYDAYSILYGVNGMSYDAMPGTRFIPETDIHDYDLAQ